MADLDSPITTTEELQERINEAIGPRLQRERERFKDYDELKTFKSEATGTLDKATQRIGELEDQIDTLKKSLAEGEIANLRSKIAAERSVPERWVIGSTQEEMEASAEAFLEDSRKAVKSVGYIPSQGTGEGKTNPHESGRERAMARYGKKD